MEVMKKTKHNISGRNAFPSAALKTLSCLTGPISSKYLDSYSPFVKIVNEVSDKCNIGERWAASQKHLPTCDVTK